MKYLKFRFLVVSVLILSIVLSTSFFVFADSSGAGSLISASVAGNGSSLSGSYPTFTNQKGYLYLSIPNDGNSYQFSATVTSSADIFPTNTHSIHYTSLSYSTYSYTNFSSTWLDYLPAGTYTFTGIFDPGSNTGSSYSFLTLDSSSPLSITFNSFSVYQPYNLNKPLAINLYTGNGLLLDLTGQSSSITINFNAGNGVLGCAGFNYGNSFTSGQSYYISSSNNLTSYNFSSSDYTLLNWSALTTNIAGKTTSASSSITITNPSGYLYIFNPLQGSEISIKNGQLVNSGYITISSSSLFNNISQFALESLSSVGSGQVINISDTGNYINDSGQLVDSSGNPTSQTEGGLNTISSSNIGDKLDEVLNSLVSSIQAIFAPATNSIHTLVNSGSAFMQNLVSLYSWLPTQITSVITSALTLFIVIGVLKLLL